MGNKRDGETKGIIPIGALNSSKILPPLEVDVTAINSIKQVEEKGSFAHREQIQFAELMKEVGKHGGLANLDKSALKELDHIVKVLGSDGDKSVMVKEEVSAFISKITNKPSLHK